MAKTREEITAEYTSEFLDVVSMTIKVDGYDTPIVYTHDMDPIPEKMHIILPEHCTYHLSISYRVKGRTIKKLHYYHAVKKAGIPMKTRNLDFGDKEPNVGDELYTANFDPDTLPGGMFVRGTFPANTIFSEDGKELFQFSWSIEIAKKDVKPSIKV